MVRRNLRKWAEAKERRAQQYAPPRGRWSYYGIPIFIEDPPFGTYLAPTTFLPMDPEPPTKPLFPKSVGEVLHAILHPEFPPGPPYTHTFNLPPTEYDEDGEPLPPCIEPSMTVVRQIQHEALAKAYETVGRLMLYGVELHPLLLDHDIDRCLR